MSRICTLERRSCLTRNVLKLNLRIHEALNLLMFADSSSNTKMDRIGLKGRRRKKSFVLCHVSRVMCHLLRVTCHLSLMATSTSKNPLPANSPVMHSRLVRKDPKTRTNFKTHKIIETTKTRVIHSLTKSLPSLFKIKEHQVDRQKTHPRTSRLIE